MPVAERSYDIGSRRGRLIVRDLAAEIRQARLRHGLSQDAVARAVRISRAQMGRIERAENSGVSLLVVARLLAVLGMELSARAYPVGQPIRDAAHRALLDRLRTRLGPGVRWSYERPIGGEGDLRAWDATISGRGFNAGVEAETRVGDVQALQRRIALRLRDDATVGVAILLLSNTRHNRSAVRQNFEALRADFPINGQAALAAMAAGRGPGGNAILLL